MPPNGLPRCTHGNSIFDWSKAKTYPSCGCGEYFHGSPEPSQLDERALDKIITNVADNKDVWYKGELDLTLFRLALIKAMVKFSKPDNKFISHIQSHLKEGQEVVCKICNKTAKEICEQ